MKTPLAEKLAGAHHKNWDEKLVRINVKRKPSKTQIYNTPKIT